MQSNFAQQWSTALGMNVSEAKADQAGLNQLSQAMTNFLQMRNATSALDKINTELNQILQQFDDGVKLKINTGNSTGAVVNEDTKRLADAFLVEAKEGVQGKWPEAWGDNLKDPLMLFIAYATANNVLYKSDNSIDWSKTLPILTKTFAEEKGPALLREQMNSIDQLMPQVLTGAAMALLPLEALPEFNAKFAAFVPTVPEGVRPEPVQFLDILLEVRTAHLAVGSPEQAHP